MRKWWLTLVVLGLCGPSVVAQPAGGGAAPGATLNPGNRLDAILMSWQQAMSTVQNASAQCTHTKIDKVLKDKEVFEGIAQFMKPNLAIIDLNMKDRPQDVEHVISTGTFVYQFVPATQVIKVYEMKTGQSSQDFLPFLQGMKAQDAKARYDLALIKEDKYWIYIQILPRLPEDKADFKQARLVLSNQTYLPRELRFIEANGNENIWDIPKIQPNNPQVTRNTFTAPKLPTGWKWEKVPLMQNAPARNDLPPRVIRPNQ
jgi:TIGR03009 family protein